MNGGNEVNAKLLVNLSLVCDTEEEFVEALKGVFPDRRLAGLLWHVIKTARTE